MDTFYRLNESQRSLWLEMAPDFIRSASLDQSGRGEEYFKSLLEIPEVVLNLISFVSENEILAGNESCVVNTILGLGSIQDGNAFWDSSEHLINSRPTFGSQEDIDGNLNRETLDMDLSSIDPCLRDSRSSQLSLEPPSDPKNEGIVRAPPGFGDVVPISTDDSQLDALYRRNHHNSGECENVDPNIGSVPAKDLTAIGHQTQSQLHLASGEISSQQNPRAFSSLTAANSPSKPEIDARTYSMAKNLDITTVQVPTTIQTCPWPFCPAPDELSSWDALKNHQEEFHKEGSRYGFFPRGRNISLSHSTTVSQEIITAPSRSANGRIVCSFPGCSNKEGLKTTQTYRTHMRKHQEDARQAVITTPPDTPPNPSPPKAHPGGQIMEFGSKPRYVAPPAFKNADGYYKCQHPSCSFVPFKSSNSYKRHCDSVHSGKSAECPYCAGGGTPGKRHLYTRADAFQKHLKRIHPSIEKNNHVTLEVIKRLRRGSGKGTTWDKTNEPAGKGFEGRDENGVLVFDPAKPKRRRRNVNSNSRPSKRRKLEKGIADHSNKEPDSEANFGGRNKLEKVLSSYVEGEIATPRTKVSLQEKRPSSAVKESTIKYYRKRAANFSEDTNNDVTVPKKTKMLHESPNNSYNLQEVAEYALAIAMPNTESLAVNILQVPERDSNINSEDSAPYMGENLDDQGGPSSYSHGGSGYDQPSQYQTKNNISPPSEERFHENDTGELNDHEAENHEVEIIGGSISQDEHSSQNNELNQLSNVDTEYSHTTQEYVGDVVNLTGQGVPDTQVVSSLFILPFDPTYASGTYQDEIDDVLKNYCQPTPITTNTFHHGLPNHIHSIRHIYEDSERRSVGLVDASQVIFDSIPLDDGMNHQHSPISVGALGYDSSPASSSHAGAQVDSSCGLAAPKTSQGRGRGRGLESMDSNHVVSMLNDFGYIRPTAAPVPIETMAPMLLESNPDKGFC